HLGHPVREPLDRLGDRLQVEGVRDLEDQLGVALREDVLVDPGRALGDDAQTEAELPPLARDVLQDPRARHLTLLGGEVVRLLDDEEERRDLPPLAVVEQGRGDPGDDELLDVRRGPAQVDQGGLALLHELVQARALGAEKFRLLDVLEPFVEHLRDGALPGFGRAHEVVDREIGVATLTRSMICFRGGRYDLMFVSPMNTRSSRGSRWRRENVSGFAPGLMVASGENSRTCLANPWAETPNRALPPFGSAENRSEPYSPCGSTMTHVTRWRSSSSMRTPRR